MLFAHLKRILKLGRLRLRGPNGAKDEFLFAAIAQNLRKLAKLIPVPAMPGAASAEATHQRSSAIMPPNERHRRYQKNEVVSCQSGCV
jgi:hypothetical protein